MNNTIELLLEALFNNFERDATDKALFKDNLYKRKQELLSIASSKKGRNEIVSYLTSFAKSCLAMNY
jgi:ribosomal protein S17E